MGTSCVTYGKRDFTKNASVIEMESLVLERAWVGFKMGSYIKDNRSFFKDDGQKPDES